MVWDGLQLAPAAGLVHNQGRHLLTFHLDKTRKLLSRPATPDRDDVLTRCSALFRTQAAELAQHRSIFHGQIKKVDDHTVEMKFTDSGGKRSSQRVFQLAVFRWRICRSLTRWS